MRTTAALAGLLAIAALGCGGGGDAAAPTTETAADTTTTADETTTTTEPAETTTTEPAETTTTTIFIADSDDDTNGDGVLDPFCDPPRDFGAGLVLQVQCDLEGLQGEVPENVTLSPGSLFELRTSIHRDMSGISGNLVVSRAPDGSRVWVIVFETDSLFATGSSELSAPDTFLGVINFVARDAPGAAIQVRGHTDSQGDPGSNQALSDSRAAAVQAFLTSNGVNASEVTTAGFGETQPIALENTPEGMAFNRRVEVVIRPTSG